MVFTPARDTGRFDGFRDLLEASYQNNNLVHLSAGSTVPARPRRMSAALRSHQRVSGMGHLSGGGAAVEAFHGHARDVPRAGLAGITCARIEAIGGGGGSAAIAARASAPPEARWRPPGARARAKTVDVWP